MSNDDSSPFDLGAWTVTSTYLKNTLIWLAVLGLLCIFWGNQLAYTLGDLWSRSNDVGAGLGKVWFIFAWAALVTLVIGAFSTGRSYSSGNLFGKAIWLSANAGFFEEILYRWLRFSVAMIVLPFFNLITFGLLQWFYATLLVPLANWVTFGALSEQLLHSPSWVIGAAIISANGKFRDQHKGRGFLRWVNSWFIGMVLFYLMFNYGLWTAIVAHFLYDAVVFVLAAAFKSVRRAPAQTNDWYTKV